jgi:4-hydroxybenzoate polyprenyltransferase
MLLHFIISGAGVIMSFYVSWRTGLWYIVIANFFCVFLLFAYSVSLKRKLLSGNMLISLLTAWVVLILCLSEFDLMLRTNINRELLEVQNKIMRIGFVYAAFAFILSVIREAIKDMEDLEGDARYGSRTIPIVWGISATKIYVAVWLIVLIALVIVIEIYILQFHWWLPFIYSAFFIVLPLLFLFLKLYHYKSVEEYHRLSNWTKLIMFTGVLSMAFFYFYL